MNAAPSQIVWPEEFHPGRAPIYVTNSRTTRADPDAVWAWLVRASRWPEWYPNSHGVAIEGGAADLSAGAVFRWSTFGVRLVTHVEEFVPGERIAWMATSLGVRAYHAWLLQPTSEGTSILTEETQYGVVARIGAALMPSRMRTGHDLWLEKLDRMATSGMP